jgi:ribonucleotide monophosphatase NagD (HAD superfamily)
MIFEHFDTVNGLILDMDGVLWNDHQPLGIYPGSLSGLKSLTSR